MKEIKSSFILDKDKKEKLIYWYKLILVNLEHSILPEGEGICEHISYLLYKKEIEKEDYCILYTHFNSIPPPKDANKEKFVYYWSIYNVTRRIKFIQEIINNLENGKFTIN